MAGTGSDMTTSTRMGEVALVTGASRGIGAHLARGFLAAGYDLAVTSTSGTGFGDLVAMGEAGGRTVRAFALDVRERAGVESVVNEIEDEFGRIDVAVHNAGVIESEHVIWESDPDEWWNVLEVNVRGAYLVARTVARAMLPTGGRISMLNSGSGGSDSLDLSAYHASKSALARITSAVTLAGQERARANDPAVLAFDLAPGVVRTDMTTHMAMHAGRTQWTDPTDVVELALALAGGELDAWAGRMVRAGTDSPDSLRAAARAGLVPDARKLRWMPYGQEDPLSR